MKVDSYYNLRKSGVKNGDIMWACAYKATYDKEGLRYVQKPIRGVLVSSKSKERYLEDLKIGETSVDYFVPFKKNGKDLAWSKAVSAYARMFASTEEECIELYNSEIQYYIDKCKRTIESLKLDMI